MRGGKDRPWVPEGLPLERRVQVARGAWQRDEQGGAIRSAGWWESVTVTWSPVAAPDRPAPLLRRALANAVDALTPSLVELMAAGARRLLDRRHGPRVVLPSSRRQLPAATRALPPSGDAG